jgi:hypothetical protein
MTDSFAGYSDFGDMLALDGQLYIPLVLDEYPVLLFASGEMFILSEAERLPTDAGRLLVTVVDGSPSIVAGSELSAEDHDRVQSWMNHLRTPAALGALRDALQIGLAFASSRRQQKE